VRARCKLSGSRSRMLPENSMVPHMVPWTRRSSTETEDNAAERNGNSAIRAPLARLRHRENVTSLNVTSLAPAGRHSLRSLGSSVSGRGSSVGPTTRGSPASPTVGYPAPRPSIYQVLRRHQRALDGCKPKFGSLLSAPKGMVAIRLRGVHKVYLETRAFIRLTHSPGEYRMRRESLRCMADDGGDLIAWATSVGVGPFRRGG
jgi:hypothetical protein